MRRNKTRHRRQKMRRGGCADLNNGEYVHDKVASQNASKSGKEICVYTRSSGQGGVVKWVKNDKGHMEMYNK